MPLPEGTRFGVFEVVTLIGAGGMGEVYRARDTRLERDVALKVLPGEFTNDRDRFRRFEREAKTLASLNHPHIVTIHDVGESAGFPFLVMELIAGPRLSQARPTDLSRVIEIAVQICAALEHAHERRGAPRRVIDTSSRRHP